MATENFNNTRNDVIEASKLNPFAVVWMLQTGVDSFKFQHTEPIKGEGHRVIGIWRNGESITWAQAK